MCHGFGKGRIFKRPVRCGSCKEDYLLIADSSKPQCPSCGNTICLTNRDYEPLLRDVKPALRQIDSASLAVGLWPP
jgi:predicted RNA-binding Zn-ribbon protein involved in translation (DUF1610 family)